MHPPCFFLYIVMAATISKIPQPLMQPEGQSVTKAIELYGDRAGSKGTFTFAGLAWLQTEKVVWIQDDAQRLTEPSEWRRFHRLATLAHRLKKPMVLWNLPVVRVTTRQPPASLALARAMQATELQLLKLPHPIITVFDGAVKWDASALVWGDGTVLIEQDEGAVSAMQQNVKIAAHAAEIPLHLSALLRCLTAIPATELIANRRESLRKSMPIRTETGAQHV